MASEVHQGKKDIPQFPGKRGTRGLGLGELADFFPYLGRNALFWIRPVETGPGRPFLEILGVEQGREAPGNAVQTAFAGGLFLLLELVPASQHLGWIPKLFAAKDMGMPANQLISQLAGNRLKVKRFPLLCQLGVKKDVEKDIPQLLLESMAVSLVDRFEQLVDLLENHGLEGAVRLLAVPRAATRAAQLGHDPGERLGFAHASALRGLGRFVQPERDETRKLVIISV